MKFLIAGGHQGTSGTVGNGILEEAAAKVLSDKIVAILKEQGHEAEEPNYNLYDKIKSSGVTTDLRIYNYILEVHFNSGGGDGTEIFVGPSVKDRSVENAILKRLSTFFNISRGIKTTVNGETLLNPTALANAGRRASLLEVCFVDNKSNAEKYLKNIDAIAKAIAYGILDGFGVPIKTIQVFNPSAPSSAQGTLDPAQKWAVDNKIASDKDWTKPATKSQVIWWIYTFFKKFMGGK